MINYAHRGASEYAPENTFYSFYLGLLQGANGIETDVQITKDGVPVLFHDDTLDRVTDSTGKIADYTLAELQEVKVYGNSHRGFYDRIPTFRAFLETFTEYDIHFAIELKEVGAEQQVVDMIHELLTELKIDNPNLIGHSFGGKLSLLYSTKYKTRNFVYIIRRMLAHPQPEMRDWVLQKVNGSVL